MDIYSMIETVDTVNGNQLDTKEATFHLGGGDLEFVGGEEAQFHSACKLIDLDETRKLTTVSKKLTKLSKMYPIKVTKTSSKETYKIKYTVAAIFTAMLNETFSGSTIYKQFSSMLKCIEGLDRHISKAMRKYPKANVSIPEIVLSIDMTPMDLFISPGELKETINKIITYMNDYNINSLLPDYKKITTRIKLIKDDPPDVDLSAYLDKKEITKEISTLDHVNAVIEDLYTLEKNISDGVSKAEKYYTMIADRINEIYIRCFTMREI